MAADVNRENLIKIDLDWDNIDTVFLDMDGTLLDLHYDNHFWLEHLPVRLAQERHLSEEEVQQYLRQHIEDTRGTLNWYCLDYWQDYLQIDIVALKHEVADRVAIRSHVKEFFAYLHALNKRVVLLTNAHHKTIALKFGYVDLSSYFDRIISSHDLSLAKEHPDFWAKLATVEPVNKAKCLFIDDNLDVLRAAQTYGVKHLLSIAQPDSQRKSQNTQEFIAVECYSQLMHKPNPKK